MFLSVDPEVVEIELPKEEIRKLHDVLRLRAGAPIGIVPGDGTLWRCEFRGKSAIRQAIEPLPTEPTLKVTLAQAMPKAEKLEEVIRMGTEIGVAHFLIFDSDRTVVKWDEKKKADRLIRLQSIVRESAEQSFRAVLPTIAFADGLKSVLEGDAVFVLSETEGVPKTLAHRLEGDVTLVIGPEGGWSPREVDVIGNRAVTLGPRVLRVDTAAAAACAIALLR
ncbi:MAG: 16S rRNA (uracil(1498)-N(3))-methyltransferase [Chthonomonas sp.]|nr:16S rRNA (uracil(1498)-N(3))-methyltransferase [Chthonomonas sp.]